MIPTWQILTYTALILTGIALYAWRESRRLDDLDQQAAPTTKDHPHDR